MAVGYALRASQDGGPEIPIVPTPASCIETGWRRGRDERRTPNSYVEGVMLRDLRES